MVGMNLHHVLGAWSIVEGSLWLVLLRTLGITHKVTTTSTSEDAALVGVHEFGRGVGTLMNHLQIFKIFSDRTS